MFNRLGAPHNEMASFTTACRLSTRIARRTVTADVAVRGQWCQGVKFDGEVGVSTPQADKTTNCTGFRTSQAELAHQSATPDTQKASTPAGGNKQTKPLMPSVHQLMRENGLDESAVGKMTPTGPQGRLLKGDVLAYLGKINASSPTGVAARFNKHAHLDLSNIKTAAPKPREPTKAAMATSPPKPEPALVTVPVSLANVAKVQAKLQETQGLFPPLSTFVSRASDLANQQLPLGANSKTSADALFNQILGLEKPAVSAKGTYQPQCSALSSPSLPAPRPAPRKGRLDVIDVIAASTRPSAPKSAATPSIPRAMITGPHVFSLSVSQGERRRAQVFLQRLKKVLETEPETLVT